ncbi:MAG: hypothetical protein OEY56_04400 [Cyclobacteriaceae bacterium]|nr:hypothetical protein [Cyclobacteriaceae bacterium]
MFRFFIFNVFMAGCLFSCLQAGENVASVPENGEVYAPVYASRESALTLTVSPAKPISKPANIFTYQQYLMVNIPNEGFHVIDNTNPAQPHQLYFVNIPGNTNLAIKDGYLYVDNYADVVAFTLNDQKELQILGRLSNIMDNQLYPPYRDVYFECVDTTKGVVVDWVKSNNRNVECYRP